MKQKLVLAMCLLLMFLVSCSNNSFTNPFGGTPSEVDIGLSDPGVDIHTGNRGVVLSKIYCPKKVTENENFICSFKMTNYGPHRVNGLLTMNLFPGEFKFTDGTYFKTSTIAIDGKTSFNAINDFVIKEFSIDTQDISYFDQYQDEHLAKARTRFCYDYVGQEVADVCINLDPYSEDTSSCRTNNVFGSSQGQGGPLIIQKIETESFLEKGYVRPKITIFVQNTKQGSVIRHGTYTKFCTGTNSNVLQDRGVVELVDIGLSNYKLSDFDCVQRLVRMGEGINATQSFTCKMLPKEALRRQTGQSFISPLSVKIRYGYVTDVDNRIIIAKEE